MFLHYWYMYIISDYLTIGVPSVKRPGVLYIHDTLASLYNRSTPRERRRTCVLIFLADLDAEYNKNVSKEIQRNYQEQLDTGFFLIITVDKGFYPELRELKQNFDDSKERVTWRSKQVVDYVFLMLYSHGASDYYLQLEDDVIAADDYLRAIQVFTSKQKDKWCMIEFFPHGFIGKMFHNTDLLDLATFFWIFYDEQPIDLLLPYFLKIHNQSKTTRLNPSLFQHIGIYSSLSNKVSLIEDKDFIAAPGDQEVLEKFAKEKEAFKTHYHLKKNDNVKMLKKSNKEVRKTLLKTQNDTRTQEPLQTKQTNSSKIHG